MPAIFFAIIPYFGWGIGDIFGAIASRKVGSFITTIWSFLFRLLIFSLFIPFSLPNLEGASIQLLILNFLLGFLLIFGLLTLNKGLSVGNSSAVGTIAASWSALVVILSMIFLKEAPANPQLVAITIILTGVILVSLSGGAGDKKSLIGKGTGFGILSIISWGIYFTFIKIPAREIGWFWASYISYIPILFIFLINSIFRIRVIIPNKNSIFPILVVSVLMTIADFGYNFAISEGLVAIVAPIAGAYPTLFAPLAFLVFKDPITKQQIVGIITTLVGIVLLSIFSV